MKNIFYPIILIICFSMPSYAQDLLLQKVDKVNFIAVIVMIIVISALITYLITRRAIKLNAISILDYNTALLQKDNCDIKVKELKNDIEILNEKNSELVITLNGSKENAIKLETEKIGLLESKNQLDLRILELKSEIDIQGKHINNINIDLNQKEQLIVQYNTEKKSLNERIDQHNLDLQEMQNKFQLQFENLANRIFDEKSEKFKKDSQQGLGQLLEPLKEKIKEFEKKVEDSFGIHAKDQFSLKTEIERIVLANEKITTQAENLTNALKRDSKTQGNWGEIILEKILEDSGLRKGINYITQGSEMGLKQEETGRSAKPDVIIKLPENKHIVVDSKVSLTHYERYFSDVDEGQRSVHLKQFLESMKSHVNGLEQKRYQDIQGLGTPDFVLMFIPIEGAYSLAVQEDATLQNYAWDKKVVIVCPTTLFATLRTIASVWRLELQNQNAIQIAKEGGALYDKIVGFVQDMQRLGSQIQNAGRTYGEAMNKLSDGQGNILKRTESLKDLGARAKKSLPLELMNNDINEN